MNQGAIAGAVGAVLLLVMLGIILSASGDVVDSIQDTQTDDSYAQNISLDTLSGMNDFSEQQGTIWLVTAVGVIIAVLVGAFAYVKTR